MYASIHVCIKIYRSLTARIKYCGGRGSKMGIVNDRDCTLSAGLSALILLPCSENSSEWYMCSLFANPSHVEGNQENRIIQSGFFFPKHYLLFTTHPIHLRFILLIIILFPLDSQKKEKKRKPHNAESIKHTTASYRPPPKSRTFPHCHGCAS